MIFALKIMFVLIRYIPTKIVANSGLYFKTIPYRMYYSALYLEASLKKNGFIVLMIVLMGGLFFIFNQPFNADAQPTRLNSNFMTETWTFGITSEGSAAYYRNSKPNDYECGFIPCESGRK